MSMMGQMLNSYTVVGSDPGASTTTTTTTTKKVTKKSAGKPGKKGTKKTTTRTVESVVDPMPTIITQTEVQSGEVVTTSEGGTTQVVTTKVDNSGRTVITKKTTKMTTQQVPVSPMVTRRQQETPREYQPSEYFKVGQDYSQFRGTGAPRGPVNQYGIPVGTPVNKILVEKIQPPKVAQSMRHLFETGTVPDLLKRPQKIDIVRDDAREAGVYENQPTVREGVVRESDEVTVGEVLEEGTTKNIVTAWKDITAYHGVLPKMSTIKIDTSKSGPAELESQPVRLEGVVREEDALDECVVPEDGYTGKLRYKFLYPEEKKIERGPIKLVEREGERSVFESEPAAPREGVIRSNYEEEQMGYEPGYIRNVAGFFANVSDDKPKSRAPIVIDRSNMTVLENTPTVREGVVRETDADADAQLELAQGRTRNLATRWANPENTGPRKAAFQMDLAPEAGVLENEPVILDNVIRCDAPTEDVMLPGAPGGIKSIANRFTGPTGGNDGPRKGMIEIDMAPESGVVENTPADRDPSIVKCDDYTEDQCEVRIEQGTAGQLHQRWRQHESEHLKVRTAMDFQESTDSPTWIREMQSKGNGGVYENDPTFRDGVVREMDVNPDEMQGDVIPSNFSRSMKNMWLTREGEMERQLQESRRYIPEPIRFTPPRDVSPPPFSQQETTQSFQTITLSDAPLEENGMDTSTTIDLSQPAPPAPTEKKAQRTERKKIAPQPPSKSEAMKSSATFTLS